MALVPCSECGQMISDKAYNCPKCGKPNNTPTQPTTSGNNKNKKGSKTAIFVTIIVILSIALIAVLAFVFYNRNGQYDEDFYNYDDYYDEPIEVVDDESTALYDDYQDDNDYSVSLSELKSMIRDYNDELPEYIDEGMELEAVYLNGDYVIYTYNLDEDIYDMDYFRTNRSDVKRFLKSDILNSTDEDIIYFINACKDNNKGISYRYVSKTSDNAYTISISPSEL